MNNDFNGNDLTVDKGSVQRNDNGPLGILSQRLNRDNIIQQQKQGLIDVGQDLAKQQRLVENLTKEFEKMKSAKDNAFSDTQIKQAVKALEDYNKITGKLKYAITDIMHSYDMGNISQEELNKKTTEYKKLLLEAQAAHEDAVDIIDIEHNKINDVTDALEDQRNLRKVIHNEQIKAIEEEGKAAEKAFKASGKDFAQAIKKTATEAKNWVKGIKDTLNIEDLARNAEMSSAQKLQTQLQQMYGFSRAEFQQWKTSGKSGMDSTLYSSEDFKKAIELVPELNLSAQKAIDLMPTIVRGQKLLGMTAEEQKQLSVLSNRTGRDMLTYTTNRIAQYMKKDENLNIKQLNEMISLNASLATRAADFGIDSEEFSESLNNATKAMTDVFGQESGKDNVYRSAMESIMSNYEQAALAYGMSEGDLRKYLNNGGTLFDLNKNSSGAAGTLYKELMYNYDAVMNDWQKYSEKVGDQNLANLVKAQVDAQRKNQDLSTQTRANAATKSDTRALNDIEKKYGDNLSLTQKAYSWFSNWVDNNFDWVTTENFYKNVIALLSAIEASITVGQIAGKGIDIIKSLLGKGGGSGSGFGSKLLGSSAGGTGIMGMLSKVGASGGLSGAGATGGAGLGAATIASGALGIGMTGYDLYKGYKEGGIGQSLKRGLMGSADFKNKSGWDNVKALGGNTLKGAAIGTMIAPGIGTLIGGGIGLALGAIGGFLGNDTKKLQKEQLEEQRRIAKNTASSAASMEALRNGMSLTGNSYDSRVPRKATMSDSELKLNRDDFSGKSSPAKDSKNNKTPKPGDSGFIGPVKPKTPSNNSSVKSKIETKPSTNGMLTYQDKNKDTPKLGAAMGSSPSAAGSPYPWRVSAGYNHYPDGSPHNGMDFAIAEGTKIGAARPGTVEKVQEDGRNTYYNDYGMSLSQRIAAGSGVWVRGDDGNRYFYWHMSKVAVKQGDKVPEGALLGYAGNTGYSTGSHLHFGVQLAGGSYTEPANFVTSGLFNASGESYTPSKSTSGLKNESTNKSSDINEILTSSYKVKLNSHYVGMGAGPGGTGFKDNTLSDVVSGLAEIKQTLINLSDRQTQDERIMNMISRQPRQDPRMS